MIFLWGYLAGLALALAWMLKVAVRHAAEARVAGAPPRWGPAPLLINAEGLYFELPCRVAAAVFWPLTVWIIGLVWLVETVAPAVWRGVRAVLGRPVGAVWNAAVDRSAVRIENEQRLNRTLIEREAAVRLYLDGKIDALEYEGDTSSREYLALTAGRDMLIRP